MTVTEGWDPEVPEGVDEVEQAGLDPDELDIDAPDIEDADVVGDEGTEGLSE